LLRVLGRRGRVAIGIAALASLLERLAIVAATFEVVGDRTLAAVALAGTLAALFSVRSVARAFLRVEIQARVIDALSSALLADDADLGAGNLDDAELELFDGLHASETLIGEHVPELLADLPACACMLVIACAALPARLAAEGAAAMLLGAGALLVARGVSARNADLVWAAFAPLLEDLSTAVRGRVELVASGARERFLSALRDKTRTWRSLSDRTSFLSFLAGRAPAVAVAFAVGLALILDEGLRGTLAHGVLGRAALLASMTPAFAGLARASLEIGKSGARVRPVTKRIERHAGAPSQGDEPPPLPAIVTLDDVSFAYAASDRAVINELVATWRPGEILALTGPNGSGKSTLLALLLGLAKPHRGAISVGGKDIRQIDARLWRQRIGYLPQRPFLPDRGTVGAAMRLLAPDAESDALERALVQVKLWPVLLARSSGSPLDTRVGSLSAGEKQRLALARVLARRSPLLLLDEPDANLDAEGLDLLVAILRELAPEHMIAVAAHSPRLIAASDRVLVLGASSAKHVGAGSTEARPTALRFEDTRS
jgi:ABC-type multidrug transport system fused ATPase/permease subunit